MTTDALYLDALLFESNKLAPVLPAIDHYAGSHKLMLKSLALQASHGVQFDVTLDCEDGAAEGPAQEHAASVGDLITSEHNQTGRVGARTHGVHHPAFVDELEAILSRCADRIAYVMIPKLQSASDAANAADAIDAIAGRYTQRHIPVHGLIETHGGLRDVFRIAAHPRIESLSFGLMDFVSAHHGAIDAQAMTAQGQNQNALVMRAKTEIAAACHAYGKTPSHNVITELKDTQLIESTARTASTQLGYTRIWSIHPGQIEPLAKAMAPSMQQLNQAADILINAKHANWGPIEHAGLLHDRASYRYYWSLLKRARALAQALPASATTLFELKAA